MKILLQLTHAPILVTLLLTSLAAEDDEPIAACDTAYDICMDKCEDLDDTKIDKCYDLCDRDHDRCIVFIRAEK